MGVFGLNLSPQIVPGLVGTHAQWTNVMASKVDKGMDQLATVAEIYDKKVRSFTD